MTVDLGTTGTRVEPTNSNCTATGIGTRENCVYVLCSDTSVECCLQQASSH